MNTRTIKQTEDIRKSSDLSRFYADAHRLCILKAAKGETTPRGANIRESEGSHMDAQARHKLRERLKRQRIRDIIYGAQKGRLSVGDHLYRFFNASKI